MAKVFIFILLGGFVGPDGYAVSPGILILAHRLQSLGEVSTHNWSAREDVTRRIAALSPSDKVVLIGYSGGGFAITEVAQDLDRKPPHKVDLLIAYDPSPAWSVKSIGNNVARAVCYCNDLPLFFGMGGAKLRGSNVETVPITEPHPVVQFDERLHRRTIAEVEKLAASNNEKPVANNRPGGRVEPYAVPDNYSGRSHPGKMPSGQTSHPSFRSSD
jgi:pimeloyl-ACP methyl ester carboxylesterase